MGGAGGSSSRASAGGGELVCAPGEARSCYSGPKGTEGIGECTAGEETCDVGGTAWGPCMGEVTPGSDSCATPEDEDCDGMATAPCSGVYQWSKHLKSTTTEARAVTSDPTGNVIVG
ncbi:MAG TPA: nucleotide-binding protein, partial [Polyangiaceae bacterium]|nr:nucleotide-binding protein [Polyangiaceae bacterium]